MPPKGAPMSFCHSRVPWARIAWVGLSAAAIAQLEPIAAIAQPEPGPNIPLGDTWITQNQSHFFRSYPTARTPSHTELPTGDIWLAPDGTKQSAQTKSRPQENTDPSSAPTPIPATGLLFPTPR
jgi:hypothetical protein